MKAYLRKTINPYIWHVLSRLRRSPNRFIQDTYEDISLGIRFYLRRRKGFTSIPCLVPFMRLEFFENGNVTTCCHDFTKVKSVGNMNNDTIEELWNGFLLKRFRKYLYLGQTHKVCMSNCRYLKVGPISVEDIRTDNDEGATLADDIRSGRAHIRSHPLRFNLANYYSCNLKCIMCPPKKTSEALNFHKPPEHLLKTAENLKKYYDKNIVIYLTGNGDVLARKDTRELLTNFDSAKYSTVSFQILTNGLLFQPEMWEKIKHNNFTYANVSIDAATKETYEKIRCGGKWEKMIAALEVFRKARDEGKFSSVTLNMTVMRSNYREIPQFIEMARSCGFYIVLTRIRGQWGNENIFDPADKVALQELSTILSEPYLCGSDIDMNELSEFVPKEIRSRIGNHLTSIWYPTNVLKLHTGQKTAKQLKPVFQEKTHECQQ